MFIRTLIVLLATIISLTSLPINIAYAADTLPAAPLSTKFLELGKYVGF